MTAILTVDLDAFERNLRVVRDRVAPADVMLVVKDDAYGHGLEQIVSRAYASGVRWFGAFDAASGVRTRAELGPGARIFVWMIAGPGDARAAVGADLDLGIGDAASLEDVAIASREAGHPARVHLKIDTGLHRNGVRPEEWPGFVARAAALDAEGAVQVVGVWSHIAEASDADDDAARDVFLAAVDTATATGIRPPLRHLAASAAAVARAEFRFDLVRVGAFCYGIRPAGGPSDAELGIVQISALDAPVTGIDRDEVRIGVGSADGLPSSLGGRVLVRTPAGERTLLAVGDVESTVSGWSGAAVGQIVRVTGPGALGVTDLAESIGTIGEEIALRMSPLLPRRYR
jgi:alanine racemase